MASVIGVEEEPGRPLVDTLADALRPRRLLLHKKEISKMADKAKLKGYTIVPLRMYLAKGRAKVEIALARGKRQYDKRQAIAERDSQREIQRELGRRG